MSEQRFEAIDLARGIALVGVALVNVHAVARGWQSHYALDLATHWGDVFAEYFVGIFFSHRSFPTLAFLFGAGIAMQWSRMRSTATDPADSMTENATALSTLRSRYVVLLGLGVAHALLLWPGDIVSTYALIALVFLIRWPKRDRTLKIFIAILSVLVLVLYTSIASVLWVDSSTVSPPIMEKTSFAQSSMAAAFAMRPMEFLVNGLAQSLLPEVWLGVLIGVWCGQTGALERWLRGEKKAPRWFALGFTCLMVGTVMELYASRRGTWSFDPIGSYGDTWMVLALPLTAMGSVFAWLAIARAWCTNKAISPSPHAGEGWVGLKSLIIAAGCTPLTQFFGQSLVFAIVFNKSLIGWHGELGRLAYSIVAVVTFFLWAGFARAWLDAGHRRGPMEIVWMALARKLGGANRSD
jgi:uncharacterized protein